MNTLDQMIERSHERVCFHQDEKTGLRAIIAIHSTALGNALGGTRRWRYATEADALYDVLRLSEGMTYKAACAGLAMGGAKSVILLPTSDHPLSEAEARAMGQFVDTFNGDYIAAEDVGVTPQFIDWMALETDHVMGGETVSTGGDPSPHTAHGVVNAMKACLAHLGKPVDFSGLHVAVQGVGSVGRNIVQILIEAGARCTVADVSEKKVKRVVDEYGVDAVSPGDILSTECDILAPCALGGVIDGNIARRLRCPIVCGSANNVLDDPDEDAAMLGNLGILYTPDFVANAGGLIELAGLYLGFTEKELARKVEEIEETTKDILQAASDHSSTHAAAVAMACERIRQGVSSREQVGTEA